MSTPSTNATTAGNASPASNRCPDRQRPCRRVDHGGHCPSCGDVITITDLIVDTCPNLQPPDHAVTASHTTTVDSTVPAGGSWHGATGAVVPPDGCLHRIEVRSHSRVRVRVRLPGAIPSSPTHATTAQPTAQPLSSRRAERPDGVRCVAPDARRRRPVGVQPVPRAIRLPALRTRRAGPRRRTEGPMSSSPISPSDVAGGRRYTVHSPSRVGNGGVATDCVRMSTLRTSVDHNAWPALTHQKCARRWGH